MSWNGTGLQMVQAHKLPPGRKPEGAGNSVYHSAQIQGERLGSRWRVGRPYSTEGCLTQPPKALMTAGKDRRQPGKTGSALDQLLVLAPGRAYKPV